MAYKYRLDRRCLRNRPAHEAFIHPGYDNCRLNGGLDNVNYHQHPIFNMMIPVSCPNVPDDVLNPKNTWANAENYECSANKLASAFVKNFEKYAAYSTVEIINAGPNTVVAV
jgi:phosphoenolpyruvate carboxykinase (ATP)